jgi:hypothetical protein
MRSAVADRLREERIRDTLALSVDERIEQALELGRRDVEFYMALNNVDRETAIRRLREVTRVGRQPSKCNDEL